MTYENLFEEIFGSGSRLQTLKNLGNYEVDFWVMEVTSESRNLDSNFVYCERNCSKFSSVFRTSYQDFASTIHTWTDNSQDGTIDKTYGVILSLQVCVRCSCVCS